MNRRAFLKTLGTAGTAGLTGCETPEGQNPTPVATTVRVTVESESPAPTTPSSDTPTSPTTTSSHSPISVTELRVAPKELALLESVDITVLIENTMARAGTFTAEVLLDTNRVAEKTLHVAAGRERRLSFTLQPRTTGQHTIQVADHQATVTVLETLLVANVQRNVYSYWERLLFTCLQGIANRTDPRIYLFYEADPTYEAAWLDWYRDKLQRPVRLIEDPYRLFEVSWPVDGYVLVDRWAPDTANLAATLTAREAVLPITERLRAREDTPALPVKHDLRERFQGRAKASVYRWALENLGAADEDGPMCKRGIAMPITLDISEYTQSSDTVYVRFEDATTRDGFGASLGALRVADNGYTRREVIPNTPGERSVLYENDDAWLWHGRRRIADRDQSWTYELTGVHGADTLELYIKHDYLVKIATAPDGPYTEIDQGPLDEGFLFHGRNNAIRDLIVSQAGVFVDLSSRNAHPDERDVFKQFLDRGEAHEPVYGWHAPRGSEHAHVYQVSSHGRVVMPTNHATNFSVHQHIDSRESFSQPSKVDVDAVALDEDVVYVTFVMSDGDAPAAVDQFHYGNWLMPDRGSVPIGWELQPLLVDLAPGMVEYFYETATSNDTFVASASGIGYTFPDAMSPRQLRAHLRATDPYLDRVDQSVLTVLHHRPIDDSVAAVYADELGASLTGVMEGYWDRGGEKRYIDGLAWLPTELPDNDRFTVAEIVADFEALAGATAERPLFIPVHVPTTQGLSTADVVAIVDRLDEAVFRVVSPDEFFAAFELAQTGGD